MRKVVKIISSSSEEIYDVTLCDENGLISLNCTCPAGIYSMICKHRIALLGGDISNLFKKSDEKVVKEFLNSVGVEKIDSLFIELREVEKELENLKKKKSKLQKEIGKKISEGF